MKTHSVPPAGTAACLPALPGEPLGEILRAIADASPVPLLVSRRNDGEILYANSGLGALIELEPKCLIGRRSAELYAEPAEREILAELDCHGRVRAREVRLAAAKPVWVQLTLEPLSVAGQSLLLGALEDVTLRREAEQRELRETERLASLGLVMAGIAHEIRTPLGALNSAQCTIAHGLDKLVTRLGELSPDALSDAKVSGLLAALRTSARVVCDGTSRVTGIARRLYRASCAEDLQACQVDLNEIVKDTLALVRHELGSRVQVQTCFGEKVTLLGFPERLNQVLVNLIVNAAHAIRARGTGSIRLSTRAWEDEVELVISDDGIGIPADQLDQIFVSGFTTKQAAGGSGLGLAISKEIVEAHQGRLEAKSEIGVGTTFTLRLPRASARRPPMPCGPP